MGLCSGVHRWWGFFYVAGEFVTLVWKTKGVSRSFVPPCLTDLIAKPFFSFFFFLLRSLKISIGAVARRGGAPLFPSAARRRGTRVPWRGPSCRRLTPGGPARCAPEARKKFGASRKALERGSRNKGGKPVSARRKPQRYEGRHQASFFSLRPHARPKLATASVEVASSMFFFCTVITLPELFCRPLLTRS